MALFVSYSPYLSYAAWASTVTVPWKSGSARLHDQLTAGQPPELCRGPRLQRGCGASGLRVGLGRTRPRVVWWVPWAGGTGWGPSWLCCRFTRWCWASLVPRLVCFLGSRPVRSWSPWTQERCRTRHLYWLCASKAAVCPLLGPRAQGDPLQEAPLRLHAAPNSAGPQEGLP